jgi:hypothetical protein
MPNPWITRDQIHRAVSAESDNRLSRIIQNNRSAPILSEADSILFGKDLHQFHIAMRCEVVTPSWPQPNIPGFQLRHSIANPIGAFSGKAVDPTFHSRARECRSSPVSRWRNTELFAWLVPMLDLFNVRCSDRALALTGLSGGAPC